uniref:Uncharacterized protein n=1 Tax=Cacopsylla melanoneura TaxID=428564 RepID=A0A8D9F9Y7_9HEMI
MYNEAHGLAGEDGHYVTKQEALQMIRKKKFDKLEVKLGEQRLNRQILEDWPWDHYTKGYGAPNPDLKLGVRKQKVFVDGPGPRGQKTTLVITPGDTKDKEPEAAVVGQSVENFGRPGGGAPQLTKSGKMRTKREEDPWLRFQFYGPTRHIVDEDLRYRQSLSSKKAYKQDLDDFIQEKKSLTADRMRLNEIHDRKMGWSDEHVLQKIKQQLEDPQNRHKLPSIDGMKIGQTREEMLTGGVELVPLLAARRKQAIKWPLGHTDITRIRDHEVRPVWTLEGERKYHGDLDKQVTTKKEFSQEVKHKDMEQQKKHFENWQKLWGRPGHGAPKHSKVKENLEYLLYHLPVLQRKKIVEKSRSQSSPSMMNGEIPTEN